MTIKINPSVEGKPLKALQYLIQLTSMPFVAAYLASTGMNWILAALAGIVVSLLIIVPFALVAGMRVFLECLVKVNNQFSFFGKVHPLTMVGRTQIGFR